jgi:hypothetical protein
MAPLQRFQPTLRWHIYKDFSQLLGWLIYKEFSNSTEAHLQRIRPRWPIYTEISQIHLRYLILCAQKSPNSICGSEFPHKSTNSIYSSSFTENSANSTVVLIRITKKSVNSSVAYLQRHQPTGRKRSGPSLFCCRIIRVHHPYPPQLSG